jgi:hypothetical protein
MEDLEMRKMCAKIVPKLLTPEQKLQRKQCCTDWKALEEMDAWSWCCVGDIWGTWQRLQPNRQRCSRLEGRRLLTLQRGDLNSAAVSLLRYFFQPTFKF